MVEGIAFLTVSGPQQGGDRCRVRCDFAKIVEAVHGSLVCAADAVASGSPQEQAVFLEQVSFDSPTGT